MEQLTVSVPKHSMYAIYICLHWDGFGGECRHIWQSHGVSGVLLGFRKARELAVEGLNSFKALPVVDTEKSSRVSPHG